MAETILNLLLIAALMATAVLYWVRVSEQVRQRRVAERLDAIRHAAAVVRATFAEQRGV